MPRPHALPDEVEALIAACIESVEQVEILLLLRSSPGRAWSTDELSKQLRRSYHSVSLRVRPLVEHGLATMSGDLVRYAASARDDGAVAALAGIYRLRRSAVIDRIFADPDPLQSFADAFCCRTSPMIAEAVYILCATTSALCAWLLLRAYQRTGTRILRWSGFAFVGLALYNSLYYADFFVFPSADLSAVRMIPAVVGLGLLCYGLIWEST